MIRRITLDNFMSHVHSVIDLAAGLNVLIGPNNCGKSAVVEAIRAVCENTQTDFMVRHGAKEASVTIETDDGHTIIWRRRKTYASYTLNGEQNDRPTDDYLQRVHALLRLPMVFASDGSEFQIHLGLQKSPIFLLNESKLRQATFFASSSDADKLLEMQRLHRARTSDDKKAHSRLSSEIETLDAKLATLQSLDPLATEADELTKQFEAWQESIVRIDRLVQIIKQLQNAHQEAGKQSLRLDVLIKAAPPPAIQDDAAINRVIRRTKETELARDRAKAQQAAVQFLSSPPSPKDVQSLQIAVDRMRSAAATKRRASAIAVELISLPSPPTVGDDAAMHQASINLKRTANAVATAKRSEVLARAELAELQAETAAWVRDNPNCPLCHGLLDAEQLLSVGGHEHA